jgi:hypothetical protein
MKICEKTLERFPGDSVVAGGAHRRNNTLHTKWPSGEFEQGDSYNILVVSTRMYGRTIGTAGRHKRREFPTRKEHVRRLKHVAEDVDIAESEDQRDGAEENEAGGFGIFPL